MLQSPLSLGPAGAPTSHAGLRVREGGEEVLALPVVVRPHSAWEVNRPVGSEAAGEAVPAWPMQLGKPAVLSVGVNEEPLPALYLVQPPLVSHDGAWVFSMAVEACRGRVVGLFIEPPVVDGDASFDGLVLLEVCLDPVDLIQVRRGLRNEVIKKLITFLCN